MGNPLMILEGEKIQNPQKTIIQYILRKVIERIKELKRKVINIDILYIYYGSLLFCIYYNNK